MSHRSRFNSLVSSPLVYACRMWYNAGISESLNLSRSVELGKAGLTPSLRWDTKAVGLRWELWAAR